MSVVLIVVKKSIRSGRMKKFFDRYLFSKLGLQVLFSVILILLFSWVFTIIKNIVLGDASDGSAVGVPVMMTITLWYGLWG